jgi:hypothetical protein
MYIASEENPCVKDSRGLSEIKGGEMGGACSVLERDEKGIQNFCAKI